MRHQKPATKIAALKRGSAERNKAEREANRSGARCYLAPADPKKPAMIDGVDGPTEIKGPTDVPAWVAWRAIEGKRAVVEMSIDEYTAATTKDGVEG